MSNPAAQLVSIDGYASYIGDGDARQSLPELIFGVVSEALDSAQTTMADIDGVVIAAHDLVDGHSLSSMITGPPAGAYLRDEIRVSDDGLVALSLAAARLQSGEASRVVVAGWGRTSERSPDQSARVGFEPWSEQPIGLSALAVSALRASAYLRTYGGEARHAAASARRERARTNRRSACARRQPAEVIYPLQGDEGPAAADVAAAVVLGTDGPVRISGIGHGTDRARIGDRDLLSIGGARTATAAALEQAGRKPAEISIAELAGLTLVEEALLIEAALLAPPGQGMAFYADNPWVNASGGSAAGECYPASGLLRLVDAVDALNARADQREPTPPVALVVAGSAVADQTTVATVIEVS